MTRVVGGGPGGRGRLRACKEQTVGRDNAKDRDRGAKVRKGVRISIVEGVWQTRTGGRQDGVAVSAVVETGGGRP